MGFETRSAGVLHRDRVLAASKRLIAEGVVFGVVHPAQKYHSSKDCPALRGPDNGRRDFSFIVKYEKASQANSAGHIMPCERCANFIHAKIGDDVVQVSYEQADTLAVIDSIVRWHSFVNPGGHIRVREQDIAKRRGVKLLTANTAVQGLLRRHMIEVTYPPGDRRLSKRGLRLTALGESVLAYVQKL